MHPKICLTIGNVTYGEALKHLNNVSLAEIRMDLLDFSDEQFSSIFSQSKYKIATYRSDSNFELLFSKYSQAIELGCTCVDIDINVPEVYRDKIADLAHSKGCKVILSYHNYEKTPNHKDLMRVIDKMRGSGADIVKIACIANSTEDCSRVLGLYENHTKLVAFCMGEIGKITRLSAPLLGAPFTYASIKGKEVASGQICYSEVESFLQKMEKGS
jgi:3-dehydroquinate dehydratase-1